MHDRSQGTLLFCICATLFTIRPLEAWQVLSAVLIPAFGETCLALGMSCAGLPPTSCSSPYEPFRGTGGIGFAELQDVDTCQSYNSYEHAYNYMDIPDYVIRLEEQPFARLVTVTAEPNATNATNTTSFTPVLVATTDCDLYVYSSSEVCCKGLRAGWFFSKYTDGPLQANVLNRGLGEHKGIRHEAVSFQAGLGSRGVRCAIFGWVCLCTHLHRRAFCVHAQRTVVEDAGNGACSADQGYPSSFLSGP